MYVTVLMDVEDLIDPESDDIAAAIADILLEEGVRATLCVVGERTRQWTRRNRHDVISSLKNHDIGFHTNLHSVHPTISEYLAPLDFERGVEEVLRRETPGVRAIEEVFGVTPSCYGGPGNTWGPAVCEAMRRLNIPAFVYAYTSVPEGGPHRFANVIAYPNGRSLNDGAYQDDNDSSVALSSVMSGLAEDAAAGFLWQQVFAGHPTRILHDRFWDDPLFVHGANPPPPLWTPAPRKSDSDLDRALENFRKAMRTISTTPGIELKTIREMNEICGRLTAQCLQHSEQEAVWPEIQARVLGMSNWIIVPQDLDLIGLAEQTRELLPTLETYAHP